MINLLNFAKNDLMPNLTPFDGFNPISVVIMDNCAIQHVDQVTDLIQL